MEQSQKSIRVSTYPYAPSIIVLPPIMAPQTPPHSRSPSLESTSTPSEFDVYSHSMTMPTASLPSGFYSMWPVAVKSRLPIMLSLRKSLSPFNLPSRPAILPKRPNSADLTGLELFAPPGGRDGSGASTPEVVEHGKPTWKYANQGDKHESVVKANG